MKRAIVAYFSPTHTTQKVVHTIASSLHVEEVIDVDMTVEAVKRIEINQDDIIIVGGPVYSSRIPRVASERLKNIKGNGQPVICIAVYGNNKYGDALIELANMMESNGLIPVAAAGFIGEHSFANDKWNIANGRPNADDLEIAREFGRRIQEKLHSGWNIKKGVKGLELPGEIPCEPAQGLPPMESKPTQECKGCNVCISVCPVGGIDKNYKCDSEKCIKCFACIKSCPSHARVLTNPMIEEFSLKLSQMEYKKPELFL